MSFFPPLASRSTPFFSAPHLMPGSFSYLESLTVRGGTKIMAFLLYHISSSSFTSLYFQRPRDPVSYDDSSLAERMSPIALHAHQLWKLSLEIATSDVFPSPLSRHFTNVASWRTFILEASIWTTTLLRPSLNPGPISGNYARRTKIDEIGMHIVPTSILRITMNTVEIACHPLS